MRTPVRVFYSSLIILACSWMGADAQPVTTARFFVKLRPTENFLSSGGESVEFLSPSLRALGERWSVSQLTQLVPSHLALSKGESGLEHIVRVSLADSLLVDDAMREFGQDLAVEYVQREIIYRVDIVPNDSAYASQWAVRRIGMEKAWDKTRGASSVVIGVIDTGIDYFHADLRGQLWVNRAEDINGNGTFEPWPFTEVRDGRTGDLDGIDNDGNGFADDVIGYDFVDQPGIANAAGGDHQHPDPDVLDEMGHGTSVSGIIGAAMDNGIGIAGIAPACRMMTLRAFDARGYGTESDVARALVYAVRNGAQVINMSFGDVQYSRVLRDVIRYAYGRGVTMAASAGNSQSDVPHFPSGYDETISVAATTPNDGIAGFSNYGPTIDLAAPGLDILTTERNGRYGAFAGTSASAPFVTGVAALVKSLHPTFSPEEIRGILIASAEDLGQRGWDNRSGAGMVNASRAVELDFPSVVRILSPKTNDGTKEDRITIIGTAASPVMTGYTLQYGYGENPSRWFDIVPLQTRQAIAETLGVWGISTLPDTTYTIRLSAVSEKGISLEDRVIVRIDHTPPQFLGVGFIPSIDGYYHGVAAGFINDEPTLGKVWYRVKGSSDAWKWVSAEGASTNNLFINSTHTVFLGPKQFTPGWTYEVYFTAENEVGLESRNPQKNFEIQVDQPVSQFGFRQKGYSLPLGRIFNLTTDFNGNGKPELLVNDYRDESKLKVLEYNGSSFIRLDSGPLLDRYPRGVGDLNGNGRPELLASFVRKGFLFEAPSSTAIPSQLIWSDSTSNTFWSITIADVNNDGRQELLAVINDSTVGVYILDAANAVSRIGTIVNPTKPSPQTGRNEFNAPRVAVGDFNRNGRTDMLFGDSDGDFFIVESTGGGSFKTIWASENEYENGSEFVAAGDFDGDGQKEFAIGIRTGREDVIPFWFFGMYRLDAQNKAVTLWTQQFYGVEESSQFGSFTRIENSLTAGNIDDDPADELIISAFPELYVVEYDPGANTFAPSWMLPLANTNAVAIGDFDGNGINEIALATPDSILFFERDIPYNGPPPVRSLSAEYLTPTQLRIVWTVRDPVPQYRLYKGTSLDSLTLFGTLSSNAVTDFDIAIGRTYVYAVSTYDSTKTPQESPRMFSRIFRPHALPVVDTVLYQQQGQVLVKVTQELGLELPHLTGFLLDGSRNPQSVVLIDRTSLLLSFGELLDGMHGLEILDLRDAEGIPFDRRQLVRFEVQNVIENDCYIERVVFNPPATLEVHFNIPVLKESAETPANYSLNPLGTVTAAALDPENSRVVHLKVGPGTPIGAIGKEYTLKITGVLCSGGTTVVTGAGSTAGVVINRRNLDDMFVFPNPLNKGDVQDFITFANLTPRATIRIYTPSGLFVKEVVETDGNGGVEWNLFDHENNRVPGGVYVFYATGYDSDGREVPAKTGKFAIAR